MTETKQVRTEKDRVFKIVFQDKKNLLSLYNALAGTSYEDASQLEVNTLEDVVFIGTTEIPDRMDMRLSDAFQYPTDYPDVEVVAHIININLGHNKDLLSKCKVLLDYVIFHQRIRDNIALGMTREKAVEAAVDSCIEDGILEELLRKEKAKIMASVLAEFDQEEYEEMIRRESKEDGFREGIEQGICIFINDKLEDGIPQERIVEKLMKNYNLDERTALDYIKKCKK